jgi:dipeptidyl aminopeptidase/acylaminoacyl peptidase
MVSWNEFDNAAPDLAARGRALIERSGTGDGLLATVRGDAPPRIHPISVGIVDGRLYAFIIVGAAKHTDLVEDGRYAMHTHQDPEAPSELMLRGRARRVDDQAERGRVADGWTFEADDGYTLFVFDIEQAVLGVRETADEWPPRYRTWRSERTGQAATPAT